ncbi:conjugal transfer protein TrbE [Synergistales bacterium]|nr:conjugal transfer protein TrbE [Synergistales bacterium]
MAMSVKNAMKTKHEIGFSDLLLYQTLVSEGIIEMKNGSLMAGFWYTGPDLESATKEEVEALSAYISSAVMRLGSGWMLHVEMIRKPAEGYPEGFFREPTNILIDLERRYFHQQEGRHFETKIALFFTYLPPVLAQSRKAKKLADMVMGETETEFRDDGEKRLKLFEDKLDELETSLTASRQIRLKRMKLSMVKSNDGEDMINAELLQALNQVINGRWHPVRLPIPAPTYLDTMLARDMLVGTPLTYDGSHVMAVSVMGYPQGCYPGILHSLSLLPFELRVSNRFIFTDFMDASRLFISLRKRWFQKRQSFIAQIFGRIDAPVNLDAANMVADIDEATQPLDSGDVCYGHHTCTVIIRGNDTEELEERAREVVKVFEFKGFNARVEKRNGMEAFIGSLPGHGYENIRRPMISSLSYADIIPTTTDWTGEEFCPSGHFPPKSPALLQAASVGSTPFRLNLHDGDVGHTLILGPTGSGKSTLLAAIASQFERYEGARIFAFDKGYSMFPLVSSCIDSAHYDIGAEDSRLRFCPLAAIDTPMERMNAQEWIEAAIVLSKGSPPTPDERGLISSALQTMAETTTDASMRTLTNFTYTVQDMEIRKYLDYYTGDSPGGLLLDGSSNDIRYRNFTVFELDHVFQMDVKLVMPIFLFLFNEIEKRLDATVEAKHNPPSLIIIDEAWLALSHEMFQQKIKEWLLVLRKKNCAVILATQNLSDVINSPIRQTILESCFTRILLPNPSAMNDELKELYMGNLGLNRKQVGLISTAIAKRHYYYAAPNSRSYRLFDLGLAPVSLSFIGASNKDDLKAIRVLQKEHGEKWPAFWLKSRNLEDWGDLWLERYEERKENISLDKGEALI